MMKKILLIIFMFLIPSTLAFDCIQYKIGDNLFIEILNGTTGIPLTGQACNFTFYTTNYVVSFGNVSTTDQNHGIYNWTINSSLSVNTQYIATAFCNNGIVSSYQFCTISEYSRNTILNINNSVNSSFVSIDTNLQGNSTRINNSFIGVNTNIYNLDINLKNNETKINNSFISSNLAANNSFIGINNKLNSLDTNLKNNETETNNSFIGVNGRLTALDSALQNNATRINNSFLGINTNINNLDINLKNNETKINLSFVGSNLGANNSFIGVSTLITNLNTNMNNNFTGMNMSFSQIVNNVWGAVTRTLTSALWPTVQFPYSVSINSTGTNSIDMIINVSHGLDYYNGTGGSGATAQEVWEYGTRELTFYPQGLNASNVWDFPMRNLTLFPIVNATITNATQTAQLANNSLDNTLRILNISINNSFIKVPADMWAYSTRTLTSTVMWPSTQFPYNVSINLTGLQAIDSILNASHGMNYYNTTCTGTTASEVWTYGGTRSLTDYYWPTYQLPYSIAINSTGLDLIWNYAAKPMLNTTIGNGTQMDQLKNASSGTGGTINNYYTNTNRTFNVILPVE